MRNLICLGTMVLSALLYSVAARATSFGLLLDGVDDSQGIRAVSINAALTAVGGLRDVLDGTDSGNATQGFRRYRPGNQNVINFTVTRDYSSPKEFRDWFKTVVDGLVKHRTVTISFYTDDHRSVLREFNLVDCEPVGVTADPPGADGTLGSETYSLTARSIVFSGGGRAATPSDGNVGLLLDGQGNKEPWVSWSGGEPALILTPLFDGVKSHVSQPGYKNVTPIVVGGSAAIRRPVLFSWLNDAFQGSPLRKRAGVTSPGPNVGRRAEFNYENCSPAQYSIEASDSKPDTHIREELEFIIEKIPFKSK